MATNENLSPGLYAVISLVMFAVLVVDFIWVANAALHAME
jgi:hypothetical protein